MLVALRGASTLCRLSCHWLGIDDEDPWKSGNDDCCRLAFGDKNWSTLPPETPSVEGNVAGVELSKAWLGSELWGLSNVAHPSFCWLTTSENKDKDDGAGAGEFWDSICEFKVGTLEIGGGWKKSVDEADNAWGDSNKSMATGVELAVWGTNGALKRSKPLKFSDTDEATFTVEAEFTDLKDIELLPTDAVLWKKGVM